MFAGHVGAGLAIGRAERRVNVGLFIFAALSLDVALWIFVLLGWESVNVPANFSETRQAVFVFPYSHGLIAGLAWSASAACLAFLSFRRFPQKKVRITLFIAIAVFSHWILDALVHAPELPIAGAGSTKLGLGLWNDLLVALIVEAAIVVAGLVLFLRGSGLSRARKISLAVLSLLILAFTIAGMTVAPPPPSAIAMAASSLITLLVVCALAFWLGRCPADERA